MLAKPRVVGRWQQLSVMNYLSETMALLVKLRVKGMTSSYSNSYHFQIQLDLTKVSYRLKRQIMYGEYSPEITTTLLWLVLAWLGPRRIGYTIALLSSNRLQFFPDLYLMEKIVKYMFVFLNLRAGTASF